MRVLTGRLGWLLALGLLAAPGLAHGQQSNNYWDPGPPDPNYPLPLNPRPQEGGPFFAGEFLFLNQTNPMGDQTVAIRGFVDTAGATQGTTGKFIPELAGTFHGTGAEALNVNEVSGRTSYEPGFTVNLGWRFQSGATLEVDWWHIADTRYSATASVIPQGFALGPQQADTFLFAPVFNFPIQYGGPDVDVFVPLPGRQTTPVNGLTFGIWNAASLMTIEFRQRFDKVDVGGRIPVWETDYWRSYALMGIRSAILWERFWWRTVDADVNGIAQSTDAANYTNIVSERMYGPHIGCGNEWYLGSNPLGALSISLDLDAALLVNIVKERARYELGDKSTAATRSRNEYTIVPEPQASAGLIWYPTQSVQVRVGYDIMAFFNTVASPQPIDFNFGTIDPTWQHGITRLFYGFRGGISLAF